MSARRAIGGTLSAGAYALLARRHQPTDPAQLAAEIRRLNRDGLKPRDIATALRLDHAAVLDALRTPQR